MLAGANAFEISDIQEDESEAALARRSDVTMLHWVENDWMEFSRSTGKRKSLQSFLRVPVFIDASDGYATSLTLTNLTARLRTLTPRRSCPTHRKSSSSTAGHIRRRRSTGSAFFLYSRISCASR